MTMMPATDGGTDDSPKELADKHDGVELDCEHITATAEYHVDLTEHERDMPESISDREFATSLAASRARHEFDLSFSVNQSNCVAEPSHNDFHDTNRWTVLVRIDQNQ